MSWNKLHGDVQWLCIAWTDPGLLGYISAMSELDEELDRLNDLLNQIPVEREGMTIVEFDGYVAALIVCPEMILPSEWLPPVWGGDSAFEDLAKAEDIIGAVMGHYNRVAQALAEGSRGLRAGLAGRSQRRRCGVGALGRRFRTGNAPARRCLGEDCLER